MPERQNSDVQVQAAGQDPLEHADVALWDISDNTEPTIAQPDPPVITRIAQLLVALAKEASAVPANMLHDIHGVGVFLWWSFPVRVFRGIIILMYRLLYKTAICGVYASSEAYRLCTWRNFLRLVRLFSIWKPTPIDLMMRLSEERRQEPFVERPGYVGVRLRWRNTREKPKKKDPWELQFRPFSIMDYFPLEPDGSLRVDQIRRKWNIDELEYLVPDRRDVFEPADLRSISPLGLYTLTHPLGYITVVEHETLLAQMRRCFRRWFRGSLVYVTLRHALFFLAFSTSLVLLESSLNSQAMQTLIRNVFALAVAYGCYTSYMRRRHGNWSFFVNRKYVGS
ncbi:hypothetical protein DFH11DRAFT_775962 [Phellopilus nigrolimitatus]|nr:hypothetical protein DFH11DRAFT_775962 [Phellopilus nigrolimitatus]